MYAHPEIPTRILIQPLCPLPPFLPELALPPLHLSPPQPRPILLTRFAQGGRVSDCAVYLRKCDAGMAACEWTPWKNLVLPVGSGSSEPMNMLSQWIACCLTLGQRQRLTYFDVGLV